MLPGGTFCDNGNVPQLLGQPWVTCGYWALATWRMCLSNYTFNLINLYLNKGCLLDNLYQGKQRCLRRHYNRIMTTCPLEGKSLKAKTSGLKNVDPRLQRWPVSLILFQCFLYLSIRKSHLVNSRSDHTISFTKPPLNRNLKCIYSVKVANPKRLHSRWFQLLWDILERENLCKW